jgi:hypothetical protein
VDGLKPAQRKVLFSAFKRNLRADIKVAQLAGYVSEHSAYHHGEAALAATIIGMAQDFVGSNNLPLLVPSGQFGTRLMGGKDAASPRYIFTRLAAVTRAVFHPADDALLRYLDDDGLSVEPTWYMPVIPMVLVNGADGIGTGWATSVPTYNPRDLIAALRRRIAGEEIGELTPWFRGFKGAVERKDAHHFTARGIAEVDAAGEVLTVSELPVGRWTQDYKTMLVAYLSGDSAKLKDDEDGAGKGKGKAKPKAGAKAKAGAAAGKGKGAKVVATATASGKAEVKVVKKRAPAKPKAPKAAAAAADEDDDMGAGGGAEVEEAPKAKRAAATKKRAKAAEDDEDDDDAFSVGDDSEGEDGGAASKAKKAPAKARKPAAAKGRKGGADSGDESEFEAGEGEDEDEDDDWSGDEEEEEEGAGRKKGKGGKKGADAEGKPPKAPRGEWGGGGAGVVRVGMGWDSWGARARPATNLPTPHPRAQPRRRPRCPWWPRGSRWSKSLRRTTPTRPSASPCGSRPPPRSCWSRRRARAPRA